MGKLLHGKTIITIENQYTGRDRYETSSVSVSSIDRGKTYQIGVGRATQLPDTDLLPPFGETATAQEDPRKKLVEGHANVIQNVLKAAETSKLEGEIRLQNLLAEIERYKTNNRHKLLKVVHEAAQAGLSVKEMTEGMDGIWTKNIADTYLHVCEAVELDTVVNTMYDVDHE